MPESVLCRGMQFTIRFQEDGSLADFQKFIRFPSSFRKGCALNFVLSDTFERELDKVHLEVSLHGRTIQKLQFGASLEIHYPLSSCGMFRYRLVSDSGVLSCGYAQVPSTMDADICPDDLRIITLVSKWMGAVEGWGAFFEHAKFCGYNMIHFTPLQQRGMSNSPFSIRNQLCLDDRLFQDENLSQDSRYQVLSRVLEEMTSRYGLHGMVDVVWNHTACDSEWLKEHPEAGYNLENSPHLKRAYELDELILWFSGRLSSYGLSSQIQDEQDIVKIMQVFREDVLPSAKLWEYFVMDVDAATEAFASSIDQISPSHCISEEIAALEDAIHDEGNFERFSKRLLVDRVMSLYRDEIEAFVKESDLGVKGVLRDQLIATFRKAADEANLSFYQQYDASVASICANLYNRVSYERLADHGPKMGPISTQSPLSATYFTRIPRQDGQGLHVLANNGWIWNADPFQNFADPSSSAYFLRDVISWGDCVKLRYGQAPADNPWLWKHMSEYTELMARHFHAFRIDNCHSTPIHVAEYLLARARAVRPALYVCAELFTGSEDKDALFVQRLGIDSLIREAMIAWDTAEMTRLILNYGGQAVGSFQRRPENLSPDAGSEAFVHNSTFCRPHNIFFDCTHDNEPPAQKRTPLDTLSNAALVAFSCCAMGSAFGYDQLVPHQINIVEENRKYSLERNGICQAKALLNGFHVKLRREGCTEVFAKCFANDVVVVSRDNPTTHEGYSLITRAAYSKDPKADEVFDTIDFFGAKVEIVLFARLHTQELDYARDEHVINGLAAHVELLHGEAPCGLLDISETASGSCLSLHSMQPGDVLVVRRKAANDSAKHMRSSLDREKLRELAGALDMLDMNYVLYRCEAEEQDEQPGFGAYAVPGFGSLPFCGLQGFHFLLQRIGHSNDLSHPFCANLRDGCWAADYILERFRRAKSKGINRMQSLWFEPVFEQWRQLPNYLRPKYFERIIRTAHDVLTERAMEMMSPTVKGLSRFGKNLALGSIQMLGMVPSTGLHPFKSTVSMSAGLPHFATHHMRCWGRDTFISFKGLLLLTGRYDVAREYLLSVAGLCYRGLIPNLLDSGRRPRYNARDATWWFLQALQDYFHLAPEGSNILEVSVPLRFSTDEYVDYDHPSVFSCAEPLKRIVHRILQSHVSGIHFREWRAGPELDAVMHSDGFNIDIGVDWRTGFVYGGNQWNCGTWMDKMGESSKAGNRGIPTTPRHGAPIELVGLLKSTLDWLAALPVDRLGFDSVERPDGTLVTLAQWAELVGASFEGHFYVPEHESADCSFRIDRSKIRRRGIYKDCVNGGDSDEPYCYQFRPNCLIALAVAPGLFPDQGRVRQLLTLAELWLAGPLGMRTLDPEDAEYAPNYFMSDDTLNPRTAHGANYHQGPEWLWLFGYYLKAWHHFAVTQSADPNARANARALIVNRMQPHCYCLEQAFSAGLPELTNANGSECPDSCWSQAWSMAQLLEVVVLLKEDTA